MKKLRVLFVFLVIQLCGTAAAKDIGGIYDDAVLKYWQKITPEDIQWNLDHVVKPVLASDELKKLAEVKLAFPLRGVNNYSLNFYATVIPPVITMPMLSLRFFGDLCLAYSWLWANGYNIDTVTSYLTMLKYKDASQFPGNRYPQPLKALGIPDNAREDPKTLDVFQKAYKSALIFILAHELAHIYYRHPGYKPPITLEKARNNEEQADLFALEIMRRIGVAPTGMTFFFTALAHLAHNRWDFPSEKEYQHFLSQHWTHPLTPERLELLANSIEEAASDFARTEPDFAAAVKRNLYVAGEIAKIGKILADEQVQRGLKHIGRTTTPILLAPR